MTRSRFLLPLFLAGSFGSLVLVGCADNHSADRNGVYTPHQPTADDIREREENTPPHVGMTRDEVLQRYGKPKRVFVTDRGERWTYFLNEGEVIGKSFIPFYIPPPLRVAVILFDQSGRVVEFHWDAVARR